MRRLFACVVLLLAALPAVADRMAPPAPRPLVAAITSDAVLVGTVTAVEGDPVKAKPHPDAAQEIEYRVVVVKIDEGLRGVKNVTQVRVGLTPGEFTGTRRDPAVGLKEDAKFLLYLVKHPTTNLYVLRPEHPSINMTTHKADEVVRRAKIGTTAIADPVKALKAESKDDRVMAACALAMYYRWRPTEKMEAVDRPADESKLLLAALAEGDWTTTGTADAGNPYAVVRGLGLEADGWRAVDDAKGKDLAAANHESFKEWLAGKGKEARVKQLVAKK